MSDKLAKYDPNRLPSGPVDQKTLTDILLSNVDGVNFLTPFVGVPAGFNSDEYDVVVRRSEVDPDPDHDEVYVVKGTNGKLALKKKALGRLATLAGVKWEATAYESDDPLKVKATATGEVTDIDGSVRRATLSRTLDLRDGSPQLSGKTDKQIAEERRWIYEHAETKARNRVMRDILQLKDVYNAEELRRPFVVVKVSKKNLPLDMSDPFVRRMVAAKQLGMEKELFGAVGQQALPPAQEEETPEEQRPPVRPLQGAPEIPDLPPRANQAPQEPKESPRELLIKQIEKLYLAKKGKTRAELSPGKPPLTDLSDAELTQIETALSALPNLQDLL